MADMTLQLFFLLNPLASIPILCLCRKKKLDVGKVAMKATTLAFMMALAFVFVGPFLFSVFNITINSFRAAGGIMIILLGISMAQGFEKEDEKKEVSHADALISILATPMLTGPATMSYLAIKTVELGAMPVLQHIVFAFVLVAATLYLLVRMIPRINMKYLDFTSRIFGLFLLALGIEMLAAGAKALL